MNIQSALKGQYKAGLAMLKEAIDKCPDEVWLSGEHPRTYWRIAYHALFYTHLYMQPTYEDFKPWAKHREHIPSLWGTPEVEDAYLKEDVLSYIDEVTAATNATVDTLDLESPETGFEWYKNMGKLDHQLMNLRHLQGHVGQLSELLMAKDVDIDWVGMR